MSGVGAYLEPKILGVTLCNSSYTMPSTLWVALCTSVTSDGLSLSEVSTGRGYSRAPWVGGEPVGPISYYVPNSITLSYGPATSLWGTVAYATLVDTSTIGSGNCHYWGALDSSRNVLSGDSLSFAVGSLTVTLD